MNRPAPTVAMKANQMPPWLIKASREAASLVNRMK
jgi:hypothetical protein